MTQRRRRILMLIGIGGPLALLIAAGVFVVTFDGSGYRATVERLIAEATGRDCAIGEFKVDLALSPTLTAERITLANAAWSTSPTMVSVERLRVELNAWSIVSGPLRIHAIEIDGVDVVLEIDEQAGPNWILAIPESDAPDEPSDGGPLADGLVLDALRVSDVTVDYRDSQQHHDLSIAQLTSSTDSAGHLTLETHGTLDSAPLQLTGNIGPLVHLLNPNGGAVDFVAHAGWDDTTLDVDGTVENLTTLTDPTLTLELRGPRLERLAERLALPALGNGPYEITARTRPQPDGVSIELRVDVDRFDAEVQAKVDHLAPPTRVDATVTAAGPDLARLGAWIDLSDRLSRLPAEAFTVNGRVTHAAALTTVEDLRIEIGDAHLTAGGHIGDPPRMDGTDIRFELTGPDLAVWSAIAGVELPPKTYSASGGLKRSADGLVLNGIAATLGDNRVNASGLIATVPGLVGSDVTFEAVGPSAAVVGEFAGVALPDEAFALSGRARRGDASTVFDDVHVKLGENQVRADGTLGDPPKLTGTDLAAHVEGPELALIGEIIHVDLPPGSFNVDGRFVRRPEGYGLEDIVAHLGSNTADVDGMIGVTDDDVSIGFWGQAAGPNLVALLDGILETYAGTTLPFPAEAFTVDGAFEMDNEGYRVRDLKATVGDLAFDVTGGIGREPAFEALDATLALNADSLAVLGVYVEVPPLPEGAVEIAGRFTSADGVYATHDVRGKLANNRFSIDGSWGRLIDFPAGITATFDVAGPDLAAFADLSPEFELPALDYDVGGHVAIGAGETPDIRLTAVNARLGGARAKLDGRLGPLPDGLGSDLTVAIDGVSLAWFEDLAGRDLPEEPAGVTGRFGRDENGFVFEGVEIGLGSGATGHRASVQGRLGEPPRFDGTTLDVKVSGPDLSPWALLLPLTDLPDDPYDITARVDGTSQSFNAHDFVVHFGHSDVSGDVALDLSGDTPTLSGRFISQNLDLNPFSTDPEEMLAAAEKAPEAKPKKKKKRVFSDEPLDLGGLERVNVDVTITAEKVLWKARSFQSLDLAVQTRDGSLTIERARLIGANDGQGSVTLSLTPESPGYRLAATFEGDALRLGALFGHNPLPPELQPPTRANVVLTGFGATAHELASGLNGHVWFVQGPGQIDNHALGLLTADLLFEVFSMLNPFAKADPVTEVECGVFVFDIADGVTTLEALALRTNKMTMAGRGKINLKNEQLDISWTSKPRKGVGISASAITNSYIKLGGSLTNPSVEIKPIEAMVTTGAAVATLGISLFARGMWDRATSGKNVCKKGMKEIERMIDAAQTDIAGVPPPRSTE